MNIKFISILVHLFFLFSETYSEKYENINRCIYENNNVGTESFEFICEVNSKGNDFFGDYSTIQCQDIYIHYYKERRHLITFQNCYLKELPIIFKWYKAIHTLNVSSTDLQLIRSRDFDYADKLETLIASNNQLKFLPPLLFSDAKEISYVDFSYNRIERIDYMAFNTTNSLTTLNLANNFIHSLDNRTFDNLNSLEVLRLDNNLIKNINNGLFDSLQNLNELNLSENQLKLLQCDLFLNSINLGRLILTANHLQEFNATCVKSENSFSFSIEKNLLGNLLLARNVGEIQATGNDIEWIFIEGDLENLTSLGVSNNRIENIPEVLAHFGSSLRSLDVSDSKVGPLNISTFAKFDNLERLFLRNTSLSNIQYGTFDHQKNLLSLDVSYNNLKTINFGMLRWNFIRLQTFYLDANSIKDVDDLTYDHFPSLKCLSIDKNNFDCDYLSKVLVVWKKQNISTIPNPNFLTSVDHNQIRINGVTCYHNSIISNIEIPVAGNKNRIETLESYKLDTPQNIDSNLMQRVEYLLTFIAVTLVCSVAVSASKYLIPKIQAYRQKQNVRVIYRQHTDEPLHL